jgi:hypothetical protein
MKRIVPFLVLACALIGCSSSQDDGMSASDAKLANDINTWAKDSGGDWSKLTPQQQQDMIQSAGSETTAKKVLEMKAHPPQLPTPGPPAKPGR